MKTPKIDTLADHVRRIRDIEETLKNAKHDLIVDLQREIDRATIDPRNVMPMRRGPYRKRKAPQVAARVLVSPAPTRRGMNVKAVTAIARRNGGVVQAADLMKAFKVSLRGASAALSSFAYYGHFKKDGKSYVVTEKKGGDQ